jgi:hypothetical protein
MPVLPRELRWNDGAMTRLLREVERYLLDASPNEAAYSDKNGRGLLKEGW